MMYGAAERRTVTAAEIECCIRSALLGEVYTTPKPGLVDCHDNGAHKDMDVKLFEISADVIAPYITKMFFTGYIWNRTPKELFIEIRKSGVRAERAMFQATGGVNTHKGMIFTMGILSAASGSIYRSDQKINSDEVFEMVSLMTAEILEQEFFEMDAREPRTHGEILYRKYGERGIRGEAQKGFPVIRDMALPLLYRYRNEGKDENSANINVLLKIMSGLRDTNVWTRGSLEDMKWLQKEAEGILKTGGAFNDSGLEKIKKLNLTCICRNLSPGGAADILGATLFLYQLGRLI